MPSIIFSESIQHLLRCPICRAKILITDEILICVEPNCGAHFPIINGVPILINEKASVFTIDDFVLRRNTYFNLKSNKGKKKIVRKFTPSIGRNMKGFKNYEKFATLLLSQCSFPQVLVIGGSILGQGMESIINHSSLEFIESDVSFGPRTMLINDSHDISFDNESFDGVIVQAVLEHVVDPYRCVDEIHRVLKPQGIVYAETPFMQQVHGGRYDFTRFTHLGHRRLFRKFKEVDSGAVGGPGMALAWSYRYFLLSFVNSRTSRSLVGFFANLTSFYLKYFDYYLIDKPGALDAASGYFFMGRKSNRILSDQELIKLYKGTG